MFYPLQPVQGSGGTVIQIEGTGFVDKGGSDAMVTVFTGGIPCKNVTAVGVVGGTESIQCVGEGFESGFLDESIIGDCTVVFSSATVVVCTVPPLLASTYKVVDLQCIWVEVKIYLF